MPETIAVVLERLAGQPDRFERIKDVLGDTRRRGELLDYVEELNQRESARYSTAMFERAGFYAELVTRETKRLRGKEQLDALAIMNEQFPRIVEAIEHAMSIDDSECLAKFAANIASPLLMQGKLELGASLLKRLLNRAVETGNRSLEVMAGRYYAQFLREAGELDKAYEVILRALELAQLEGDETELARSLIEMGNVTRDLGRYEESTKFYEQALEHGRRLRDMYLISGSVCSLGIIANRQDRLDDAKRLFTESLEIARETGNIYRLAGDLHNLANIYLSQGDYRKAQEFYQEALELNRSIGNRAFELRNLEELGTIALYEGRFDEAKQLYLSAQSIAAETGSEIDLADCEHGLGVVTAAMESFEAARGHFETGIQLARKARYKYRLVYCLIDLGALHCDLGEYKAAELLLSEAYIISKDIGGTLFTSSTYTGLAQVALGTGHLPEAADHLVQALKLSAEAGIVRDTLITLRASVLLLAIANRLNHAALLACGITHHLRRMGLVFGKKWHRDLDEAITKCEALLAADQLRELEEQAALTSLEELTNYALNALAELQAELATNGDGGAVESAPDAAAPPT